MMDIYEIRRLNLIKIVSQYESDRVFCEAADISTSYLPQLKMSRDKKSGRKIGEKVARKIEDALGIERMSLDSSSKPDSIVFNASKKAPSYSDEEQKLIVNFRKLNREMQIHAIGLIAGSATPKRSKKIINLQEPQKKA